jgi:hypothetical protein
MTFRQVGVQRDVSCGWQMSLKSRFAGEPAHAEQRARLGAANVQAIRR